MKSSYKCEIGIKRPFEDIMKDQLKGPKNNNNDQIVAANYKNTGGPSGDKNTGGTANNENNEIVQSATNN